MRFRRIAAALLAAVLTLGCTALPASAAGVSRFSDVSDPQLAREVDQLYTVGIINGVGGNRFDPKGMLTRAQFCKMAVVAMNKGDSEPQYRSRTIFTDVTASHWARGYINYAATGETPIISGIGNGRFDPNATLTYAQAVTILLRLLGYTDEDAGMLWPNGYLALAADIGLTDGLNLGASSKLTRAQAAHLFCNLLAANRKDGTSYLTCFGSVQENLVLMNNHATYGDGSRAIETSAGLCKTEQDFADSLVGLRGKLVTDSDGNAVLFVPNSGRSTTITVDELDATWVRDTNGKRHTIPGATPAYTNRSSGTWASMWITVRQGMQLTIYWTDSSDASGVYIHSADADSVMVVRNEPGKDPFSRITGGDRDYQVYKNSVPATLDDVRRYDVGSYDRTTKTLRVSDMRISGYYESASPNRTAAESVTILGHKFEVLESAQADLASFDLGDQITLLLTEDCRVAGVVSATTVRGQAVGVVTGWSASKAEVTLLDMVDGKTGEYLVVSGKPGSKANLLGELVSVSGPERGSLSINVLAGNSISGDLNVAERRLGSTPLSPAVRIFDRVGKSAVHQELLSDLSQAVIASSRVRYARKNFAGQIDVLVLNDATGDGYTYGMIYSEDDTIILKNGKGGLGPIESSYLVSSGKPGGIALTADGSGIASVTKLPYEEKVDRTAFYEEDDHWYVTIRGEAVRVSDEVACYNRVTDGWFETLDEARAYSANLTVFYDRAPDQGGKIRVVRAD